MSYWHAVAPEIADYPTSAEGEKVKAEQGSQGSQLAHSASPLLFQREDWSLYVSLKTLPQRVGVPANMLPWLVVKEFADNALDACDNAGRPGEVTISVENGNLIIEDQGTGIADATPASLASIFCVARPMLSSKLLRRPTRGAIGNGLRVCLGYLTATGAMLVVETGTLRVKLSPETDGQSRVVSSETIAPRRGLKLIAITDTDTLDALELARESGQTAFTGRPSPHWFDRDHFLTLLRSAVGTVSVRQFLGEFEGLTGSHMRGQIAGKFLRRLTRDLTDAEGTELLTLAQQHTKPPKAKALRPLGKDAVPTDGYAMAEGSFTDGEHAPRASIPFLVECWCDALLPSEQEQSATVALFMNRTKALLPCSAEAWHGALALTIGAVTVRPLVPAGPHYNVTIAITASMYPMVSDGKQPDVSPFRTQFAEVISKAAKLIPPDDIITDQFVERVRPRVVGTIEGASQ
jgi:hypothetical protein